MARLTPCPSCGAHVRSASAPCPHCGGAHRPYVAATVLGLFLAGCPTTDKESVDDTGPGETDVHTGDHAEYGMALVDEDKDGYYADYEDCNDKDATVNPGAKEIPGDGIDSNCNGDDNT